MILNKFIKIKVKGCRKLKYFESLGYKILDDFIEINTKDLNKGSREKVEVECDYCKRIVNITYKEYLRNISIGNKYACSMKCGSMKSKETNIVNFGVEHPMKLKEIQEKAKKTNLDRYGVEYLQQSDEIKNKTKEVLLKKWGVDHISKSEYYKEKFKETCLKNNGFEYPMMSDNIKEKSKQTLMKNWGVDNPSKSNIIRDKVKETCVNKWGVENYMLSDDFRKKSLNTLLFKYNVDNHSKSDVIQNKIKETCLSKWGVENYISSNDFKEKSKQTLMKNWGVDNPYKSDVIRDKIKQSNLEKWGIENYMLSNDFREKSKQTMFERYGVDSINKNELYRINNFSISQDAEYIKYVNDGYSLFKCPIGHEFLIHSDNYFHRKKSNLTICTICYPIDDLKSIKEKELYNYISSIYHNKIVQSYRDGLEIDIYLPELKLGFEFNGLYWHSEQFKDKWYHLNKTNYFKERGIRIIHIWEDDWVYKNNIIKSQITNWIGATNNKIYARKCIIKEIESKLCSDFLNNNHMQGGDNSNKKIGLFYNNEMVSVMTFNKIEGRKKLNEYEWNLSRFCNKLNINVIGGASKLLNYFIKNYNPGRIISYADNTWSSGELYEILNFKKVNDPKPDYKYIINGIRKHKQNFKKSNLKLDKTISESNFMKKNNFYRIWDCGKIKFEIIIYKT